MSVHTLRQRQAMATYRDAQRTPRSELRSNVVEFRNTRPTPATPSAPPAPHLEDTVLGAVLFIAMAFIVLGVVGVRFFHVFSAAPL